MSGVYIKGMEIPKAQFQKNSTLYHLEGTIFVYPDGKARAELSVDYNKRKSHPLVPVPPHGRLIDADALIDSFDPSDFWNPDAEDNCFAAIHVVNCAPTIIEEER